MTGNQEIFEQQDMAEIKEWMKRMEESNAQQAKYAKRQYALARIRAICSGCVLAAVILCIVMVAPRLISTFEQIETAMSDMEVVIGNLQNASDALAKADLAEMLDGVNLLVEDSQKGITEAMDKVAALDIETMNEAIADLKAVVEPMAKLFRR